MTMERKTEFTDTLLAKLNQEESKEEDFDPKTLQEKTLTAIQSNFSIFKRFLE